MIEATGGVGPRSGAARPHRRDRIAARFRSALPDGGTLPDEVSRQRHRGILTLLWLHVPVLYVFAVARGNSWIHALVEVAAVAILATAAQCSRKRHRESMVLASLGLMTASGVLVHLSGGVIEAHFHFFVMVGVVVLYQDRRPFLIAIAFVVLHHGVMGVLAPEDVYNHQAAWENPWTWAAIHGLSILGMSATGIVTWRASESLQRATNDREHKLAEAQELAQLGSWQWERATGCIRWSDEQYRLLGFSPESDSPTLENFLGRVHRDDVHMVSQEMATAWDSGTSFAVDFRIVLPGGSLRWLHGRGAVSEWDGPVTKRMHGTSQDITALRVADDARRASEARYRKLVETAQEGIWSFDAHYRTTFVNSAMAEMLGYSPSEMLGRSLLDHVVEGGPDREQGLPGDRWRHAPQHDCKFRGRDGHEFWALVSVSWESSLEGRPAGGLATVTDITIRKQAEASLAAARDQATQTSRLKSQFLANTSHEIRTPMTVILGMNELLFETNLDATQRRFAEGVQRAGTGLLALINDILDFSKIEAGKLELEIDDFDLRSLVDEVEALLADTTATKGLQLVFQCDSDVPAAVRGDGRRVRQILVNLVSNAVKFTDRGEVAVRVSRLASEGQAVRFEVADTGIGIAPEDQWRLFQPFSQVDGSNTRSHGGTGLGLAISNQLAEAMGGTIAVQSTPGTGSTFWLDIPFERPRTRGNGGGCGHVVQFYESEALLVDCVSSFVTAGLDAGEAVVVVATPAHQHGFDAALEASGIDVSAARRDGQYITRDAFETLSTFMVDGAPDPRRFSDAIGTLVAEAATGRRVRVFGEMVALLWAEGNIAATLRLEELWNDLAERQPFSLLCAYPAQSFPGASDGPEFREVRSRHTDAIPATLPAFCSP